MPFAKSLVGAVLIGGTLALALAPAAEATPPPPSSVTTAAQPHAGDDEVHASYTRRFTVTNLSSKRLQLLSVDGSEPRTAIPRSARSCCPGSRPHSR